MATKTPLLKQKKQTDRKGSVMMDVFTGIDQSTARHRIPQMSTLYEAINVFPYDQGRLMRRKDIVDTNSRDSDNNFPTFPAQTLVGNPVVTKIEEFNETICIFYEDSGDTGKLLMDSFAVGANTLTARITKTSNSGSPYTYTAGGKVDASVFAISAGTKSLLMIAAEGSVNFHIDSAWALTNLVAPATEGINAVFLQCYFFKVEDGTDFSRIDRYGVASTTGTVSYYLTEPKAVPVRMITFGYQTSSAGATSNLLIFYPSSIWLLNSITATASFDQVSGNIGLVGSRAVVNTPYGLVFVGRDNSGLLNIYLLDRVSLTLHIIGHELYNVLNDIPKANYGDILVSYDRNRLVRIALTRTGDSVTNNQEYWIDLYNGVKSRTIWGKMPLPASNSILFAMGFSGGQTPANSGFFMLLKNGTTYKIWEETDADGYSAAEKETDDNTIRTKMFDFGDVHGIIPAVRMVAKSNGAKYNISYEEPKTSGTDNDTTSTLIVSGTMGTTGEYETVVARIIPAIRTRQIAIKVTSSYDASNTPPLEVSQIGFDYVGTFREIIS